MPETTRPFADVLASAHAAPMSNTFVQLPQTPTQTPDYGGPILPTQVLANAYPLGQWLPEDNDNAQHTDGTYTPEAGQTPPSSLGAPISIALSPASLVPGMVPSTNDGYLSSVTLAAGYLDMNTGGFTSIAGSYYIQDGTELTNGMVLQDYAGNVYNIVIFSGALIIGINSAASTWKPVDLSQLGLVFRPDTPNSDQDIFLRVLHKECYNGILQLRSSLCNTVQNVRQSGL